MKPHPILADLFDSGAANARQLASLPNRLWQQQTRQMLEHLHPFCSQPLHTVNGQPQLFSSQPLRVDDVDAALGRLTTSPQPAFAIYDESHLQQLQAAGARLFNGKTFILQAFDGARVDCAVGNYFDALCTCHALQSEFLQAFQQAQAHQPLSLPLRTQYQQQCPQPFCDGSGRSAMLGVSALLVDVSQGRCRALLRRRTTRAAVNADVYHVLPSAVFQPFGANPAAEFSLLAGLQREFLEEVLGDDEPDDTGEAQAPTLPNPFNGLRVVLTGYAFDWLSLRPELCALILLDDPAWLQQPIKENWEFSNPDQLALLALDLARPPENLLADLQHLPAPLCTPAQAAFWLGVAWLHGGNL